MGSLDPDEEISLELEDSGYVQDEMASKAEMEECSAPISLLDLSDDVLLYILKNLSAPDLKALGFTCVRLGALVLDHTLWVDVDGGDVPHGRKRVRWMLMRVLGPHTRSLRLTGYAAQASGCLGFVTRLEREDESDGEMPPDEERCDNTYPFWRIAEESESPWHPMNGRPVQFATRPPSEPVAGPSTAPDNPSSPDPSPDPFKAPLDLTSPWLFEPGPSQLAGFPPQQPAMLPSLDGSSQDVQMPEPMATSSAAMSDVESEPQANILVTSDPKIQASGSGQQTTQALAEPSASESQASLAASASMLPGSEPHASASGQQLLAGAAVAQPVPGPSPAGLHAAAAVIVPGGPAPAELHAGVAAAEILPGPSQGFRNQKRFTTNRSYSTSNTTCPGPQLTFTHTGLRALSTICSNLTTLELDHCVIDCQTTNIGQFPKTLLRLSLRGTKCFNMESKTFLFKIQDHLPNLEDIDLSYCAWIEPACMLPLSKMPNLIRLLMRECPKLAEFVAYASLATRYGFKTLKVLDLRGSPVGDSEVSALGWLPALEELYLSPSMKSPPNTDHAHYKEDALPEFQELDDWEESDPEYYRTSEDQEAEWTRDEESAQGIRNRFYNCEDPTACIMLERMIAEPDYGVEYRPVPNLNLPPVDLEDQRYMASRRRREQRVRETCRMAERVRRHQIEVARIRAERKAERAKSLEPEQNVKPQLRRRSNSDQMTARDSRRQMRKRKDADKPGPSGEGNKPGTSGQKRKSDKKSDSDSTSDDDDDDSPSKTAARTRTVATQTGRTSKNNGKGSKKAPKKTKTVSGPRRLYQITIKDPYTRAERMRAVAMEAAANNNNGQDNERPAGPSDEQPMDVDPRPANDNQNPVNPEPAELSRAQRAMRIRSYTRGMRKYIFAAHRAAYDMAYGHMREQVNPPGNEQPEAEIPNRRAENEAERAANEAQPQNRPMEVEPSRNQGGHNPAGPNENSPNDICLYAISNRRVVYYRHRNPRNPENRREAGNPGGSARTNDNGGKEAAGNEAGGAVNEAGGAVNEAGGAVNEAGGAVNEAEASNEAGGSGNEAGQGNSKKDAANQTRNLYNGVPGIDDQPLTPQQEEINRIRYENRNHNITLDNSHHVANIGRNLNCSFHNAARSVLNAFARINDLPWPGVAGERPGVVGERPGVVGERPGVVGERPGVAGERPGVPAQRPGVSSALRPCVAAQRQAVTAQRLAAAAQRLRGQERPERPCGAVRPRGAERNRDEARANRPFVRPAAGAREQLLADNVVVLRENGAERQRGQERHRFFQFREYRRPMAIEDFMNNICFQSRNQRPRGVIFAGLIPTRLERSSLVSDASIRRFGRTAGENIVYLGGGPVPPRGNSRPDRSNLRILSVTGFRHVTDLSLSHLVSAAPFLQTLDVTGTGVTARAARTFRAVRPDVELITNHLMNDDLELD